MRLTFREATDLARRLRLGSRAADCWRGTLRPTLATCVGSRRVRRLVATSLVVGGGGVGWLYATIRGSATTQPDRPADVIIVLGAGWEPSAGLPKRVYRARLLYARDLHERGLASHIIVTERAPAAEIARDYLVKIGI